MDRAASLQRLRGQSEADEIIGVDLGRAGRPLFRRRAAAARGRHRKGQGIAADRAVLSSDYLTAPVNEIGKIKSLLTMVGGRVVYADQPFAKLAPEVSR